MAEQNQNLLDLYALRQQQLQFMRRRNRNLVAAVFSVTWQQSERRREIVRYLQYTNSLDGFGVAELNAIRALQQTPIFQQAMTNRPDVDDLSTTQWYQNLEQTYESLLLEELGLTDDNAQGQEESKEGD